MKNTNFLKDCIQLVAQLSPEGQQDVLKYIEFCKYKQKTAFLEKMSKAELIDELKRRNGI